MCNNLAGDYWCESVIQKAIYLEIQYQRKYGKHMSTARWTRNEMEELSGNLKLFVESKQFAKLLIKAKLQNLDRVINGYTPNPIRGAYKRKEVTRTRDAILKSL